MFVSCLDTGHRHSKLILYSFKKEAGGGGSAAPGVSVCLFATHPPAESRSKPGNYQHPCCGVCSAALQSETGDTHCFAPVHHNGNHKAAPYSSCQNTSGASSKAQAREWIARLLLGLNLYTQSNRVCTSWTRK